MNVMYVSIISKIKIRDVNRIEQAIVNTRLLWRHHLIFKESSRINRNSYVFEHLSNSKDKVSSDFDPELYYDDHVMMSRLVRFDGCVDSCWGEWVGRRWPRAEWPRPSCGEPPCCPLCRTCATRYTPHEQNVQETCTTYSASFAIKGLVAAPIRLNVASFFI